MKKINSDKILFKNISGFTLIELLIVVAIIAILAAIALPNFLEAQIRSKVSRAKADMSSIATALESYHTDNNSYPQAALVHHKFTPLTTPIAYMSRVPDDPFRATSERNDYQYGAMDLTNASRWIIASVGPDLHRSTDPIEFYPGYEPGLFYGQVSNFDYMMYDPTNGTISVGDIYRTSDFNLQ